jgi:hypothetical protein
MIYYHILYDDHHNKLLLWKSKDPTATKIFFKSFEDLFDYYKQNINLPDMRFDDKYSLSFNEKHIINNFWEQYKELL